MTRKTVGKIAASLERRSFLQKLILATGALLGGVLGTSQPAYATTFLACCALCKDPAECRYTGCACEWAWVCDHIPNCARWLCKECYTAPPCNGGCFSVKCSKTVFKSEIRNCTPK